MLCTNVFWTARPHKYRRINPCEGQVHLSLGTMPVADILADVNKGAVGDTNLQRLLVVAPDRVLLLAEEQSLIEIR